MPEGIGSRLIAIKSPSPGPYPYLSMAVLEEATCIVVRELAGIARVVDIAGKLISGGV